MIKKKHLEITKLQPRIIIYRQTENLTVNFYHFSPSTVIPSLSVMGSWTKGVRSTSVPSSWHAMDADAALGLLLTLHYYVLLPQ